MFNRDHAETILTAIGNAMEEDSITDSDADAMIRALIRPAVGEENA